MRDPGAFATHRVRRDRLRPRGSRRLDRPVLLPRRVRARRSGYPRNWSDIPGAAGWTLESITYRDNATAFAAHGTAVLGVSTQRPDQLEDFAAHAGRPGRSDSSD